MASIWGLAACEPRVASIDTEGTTGGSEESGEATRGDDAGPKGSESGSTEATDASGPGGSTDDGTAGAGTDDDGDSSTGSSSDAIDCAALPTAPVSITTVPGARGYHGLVITPDGDMIGSDETSLIRSSFDGDWSVFVPGIASGHQMQWLPQGGFAFVVDAGLSRVNLDATIDVVHPDVAAYGIALGPNGQIWAATAAVIFRIDPVSGERAVVLDGVDGAAMRTIGFSPDDARVYVGTESADGLILAADLDGGGSPTSPLSVFAEGVGTEGPVPGMIGGPWHDTLEVDACGNLYVSDFNTWTLYRISAVGEVLDFGFSGGLLQHAHAMVWGTGKHGWRADALYAAQPYNEHAVVEIVVGAPSREFSGEVVNNTR